MQSDALFLYRNSCECLKEGDAEKSKLAKEAEQYKVSAWQFLTLLVLSVWTTVLVYLVKSQAFTLKVTGTFYLKMMIIITVNTRV